MVCSEEEAEIEWDVDMEIQLFYAMANHKPVGINRYFHMASICFKLADSITKELSTYDVWKHLRSLYDISMLYDTEPIPFPHADVEFNLCSDSEYEATIKQKCRDVIDESEALHLEVRSSSPKPSTPRSSSRGTASKDSTPKAVPAGRKDSVGATAKSRKESGSSHASTDTPSIKSEKDYDRRRDSRDSNASGPRDSSSSGRKSTSHRERLPKSKASGWDSPLVDEEATRRGRRRAHTATPPATAPAKRRRT